MKVHKPKANYRKFAITAVLAASLVCYICIFNLVECPARSSNNQIQQTEEIKEVSLPEVKIMKTVLERARDVFTIMSKPNL